MKNRLPTPFRQKTSLNDQLGFIVIKLAVVVEIARSGITSRFIVGVSLILSRKRRIILNKNGLGHQIIIVLIELVVIKVDL